MKLRSTTGVIKLLRVKEKHYTVQTNIMSDIGKNKESNTQIFVRNLSYQVTEEVS